MVERGYFKDDFVRFFTQKSVRRSPLINLGYYVRATVVETFLKSFLQNASSEVQILSLGAGFDTSFFRLQSILTASFKYYEVDFPEVVHNKIGCMVNNEKLSTLLGSYEISDGGFELRSARYCIVSQDLSDTAALDKALVSLGMDYNLPTLLFSECAITYMREEESTGLIGWAARSFPKGIFFTYEQIHPDDGFGMFMKKHFQNINSPICSVDAYKTLEDQNQRYLSAVCKF
ncbi:hypothetical protein AAG570_001488 [Ranatra chinensis]|uniref:[phosphatase 2A protein]-leucine-carboxy methyltransferase n=1 Tax=Ranatra chinensis TaxID=642074 RepID=A0ABD0Y8Q0_9HEMI